MAADVVKIVLSEKLYFDSILKNFYPLSIFENDSVLVHYNSFAVSTVGGKPMPKPMVAEIPNHFFLATRG